MDGSTPMRNPAFDGITQLHSGVMFNLNQPDSRLIYIEDIAHALSNLCRYCGHTKTFYSVAQHSVIVSRIASQSTSRAMWGLLHDAHEAFIGDIPTAVKHALGREAEIAIQDLKDKLDEVVLSRFGVHIDPIDAEAVKHADLVALATEKRDILAVPNVEWGPLPKPSKAIIIPVDPHIASGMFMDRFWELVEPATGGAAVPLRWR